MSKYIIEIKPEYEDKFRGVMILGAENSNLYVDSNTVDELEELTSDYVNEHFGELQDEAYQKGINDGSLDVKQRVEGAYQRGLDDAWEAARKVGHCKLWDDYTKDTGKPSVCAVAVLDHYTAYEAIAKLKAYEEKQKAEDEIKVGDEVAFHHDDGRPDTVVVVTYIGQDGYIDGMDGRGTQYAHKNPTKWTKTGRHFDIASILEDMRHD